MGARRRRSRSADGLGARIGAALHNRVQGAAPSADLRQTLLRAAREARRPGSEAASDGLPLAGIWAAYWLRAPALSWR